MKNLRMLSVFLVFFTIIGFVACDVEPIDPVLNDYIPEEPGVASFTVDFSNQTYQATTTTVAMVNGVTTITAVRATDGAVFTITVPGTTPGTYNTSLITYSPAESVNMYTNTSDEGVSGSVTLTTVNTVNHTITGTFNFTGYWSDDTANLPTVQFTNGVFTSLPYTTDTDPDPTPADASFTAVVDGEDFVADDYLASVGQGLIAISGFKANGESISIAIEGISAGTYTDALLAYQPNETDEYGYYNINVTNGESSGSVTISNIDTVNHTISGTFSFTGWYGDEDAGLPNKEITEGHFENIPYSAGSDIGDDELTATVDGMDYDYTGDIITTYAGATEGDYSIGINGVVNNDHKIRLSINENLGIGTYPITDNPTADVTAYYTNSSDEEFQATEGTLIITSQEDGFITGTFEFSVTDDGGHQITSGTFDVEYD